MPTRYDFNLYRGADFQLIADILTDGLPADLSGFFVACQIKKRYFKDGVSLADLTTDNGKIEIRESQIVLNFDHFLTDSLPPATYNYDVVLISQEDYRTMVIQGEIKVMSLITNVEK